VSRYAGHFFSHHMIQRCGRPERLARNRLVKIISRGGSCCHWSWWFSWLHGECQIISGLVGVLAQRVGANFLQEDSGPRPPKSRVRDCLFQTIPKRKFDDTSNLSLVLGHWYNRAYNFGVVALIDIGI
jgi:hypothetical protein